MKNKFWKFSWWNFITIILSLAAIGISVRSCDEAKRANVISEAALKLQRDQHKKLIKPELEVIIQASKFSVTSFSGTQYIPKDSSYSYKIKNIGTGKATLETFNLDRDSLRLTFMVDQKLPLNIQPGRDLIIHGYLRNRCNLDCNTRTRDAMESFITMTYSDEIGNVYKLSLGASHTIRGEVKIFNGFSRYERELADTLDAYAKFY